MANQQPKEGDFLNGKVFHKGRWEGAYRTGPGHYKLNSGGRLDHTTLHGWVRSYPKKEQQQEPPKPTPRAPSVDFFQIVGDNLRRPAPGEKTAVALLIIATIALLPIIMIMALLTGVAALLDTLLLPVAYLYLFLGTPLTWLFIVAATLGSWLVLRNDPQKSEMARRLFLGSLGATAVVLVSSFLIRILEFLPWIAFVNIPFMTLLLAPVLFKLIKRRAVLASAAVAILLLQATLPYTRMDLGDALMGRTWHFDNVSGALGLATILGLVWLWFGQRLLSTWPLKTNRSKRNNAPPAPWQGQPPMPQQGPPPMPPQGRPPMPPQGPPPMPPQGPPGQFH